MPVGPRPAVHLRDLPRDERGFLVPAETPWQDGTPRLSKLDPTLVIVLTAYRACAVCGFSLRRDELVWRIVDEYSRATTFDDMRLGCATFRDPPGHLSCMLYSALVCPYWRTEGSRLSKDSDYTPGGRRGEVASILGFQTYALLMEQQPREGRREHYLFYERYEREITFRLPETDLMSAYEAERKACGGRYVERRRRHYAPQFGGEARLRKEATVASERMATSRSASNVPVGGVPFAHFEAGWA